MKHVITLGYILASLVPLVLLIWLGGQLFGWKQPRSSFGEKQEFGEYVKYITKTRHHREINLFSRGYKDVRYQFNPLFADSAFATLSDIEYISPIRDTKAYDEYARLVKQFGDSPDTSNVRLKHHSMRGEPCSRILYAYRSDSAIIYISFIPHEKQ